jgi:hypothetical protein
MMALRAKISTSASLIASGLFVSNWKLGYSYTVPPRKCQIRVAYGMRHTPLNTYFTIVYQRNFSREFEIFLQKLVLKLTSKIIFWKQWQSCRYQRSISHAELVWISFKFIFSVGLRWAPHHTWLRGVKGHLLRLLCCAICGMQFIFTLFEGYPISNLYGHVIVFRLYRNTVSRKWNE